MAVAYVNSASTAFFSGTPQAVSITPTAAAHLLVIVVCWGTTTASITGVTGNGNTYTLIDAATDGSTGKMSTYYVASCASGATSISVAWGADPGFGFLAVHEVSGTDPSPLDQHNILAQADPGTGVDAYTSTAVTPTTDGQYLFGAAFDEGGNTNTWTKGTAWTALRQAPNGVAATEDFIQSTAGSIAAKFKVAADPFARALVAIATFKPLAVATLEQEGYRFRNDDGSETTATWRAAQDTNVTVAADTAARLRMLVNATNDPTSKAFKLQYRKVGAASWRNLDTFV